MLSNHVSCYYVVTSVTFYHSATVEISQSRSVHAVEHDPCCPDPTKLSAEDCKAVHYGLCSPLLKLPSFTVPPAQTTSAPSSPGTPKKTSSTPSSPVTPKGTAPAISELLGATTPPVRNPTTINSPVLHRSASPIFASPVTSPTVTQTMMSTPSAVVSNSNSASTSAMDVEMLDPVTLLACDLEDQLQSLVSTFVAQDKVRLAARKKAEISPVGYKSGPISNQTTPVSNKSISPIKKYDKKIKDDRSSGDESPSSLCSETSQTSKQNGLTKLMTSPKGVNVINDPLLKELRKYSPETHSERNPFSFDQINKQLNVFTAHFEENLQDRSSSPSFKSATLPTLKPSPEYQQTGVKAQITKFASKEKDAYQNSPTNSLDRRQITKPKPAIQEPFSLALTQQPSGPLSLDALQELLQKSQEKLARETAELETQPKQATMFQSSRATSVPYIEAKTVELLQPVTNFGEEKFVPFYVNEACKDHNDFTPSTAPIPSQSMLYHQQTFSKPGQDYVQSAVDYAKTRIQSVQQGIGRASEDTRPRPAKNGHLVSDAKSKWETNIQQDYLVTDIDNESFQRGSHKRTLSMEGLLDVPSPSIPHPKLTTAQKQHIKERSLSPTDRHSHVPIRPFLTKGSVAERVLLFECCPDRALERTASGNKSKQNLISTWRPGNSDVQNKTQDKTTSHLLMRGLSSYTHGNRLEEGARFSFYTLVFRAAFNFMDYGFSWIMAL
ncbi:hypothetical protein JTE90_004566 [Oedothorax gibbosus]|uniref:Uncharacterized protein n=1 Tax=Oedothorax gibbosus TaxID=931172 RepID=A0AAV6UJU3_9ARAC|nr:hypothetical protein JTE90_004566 [Oedothorax gibbosus]